MVEVSAEIRHGSVCDHLVQVYRDQVDLAEAVAVFFSSGFAVGESAIAVPTAAHWAAITERLEKRGHDPDRLQIEGRLVIADADETLAAIWGRDVPSQRLFKSVVGGLLDNVVDGRANRRVRVFGEMVDILCRRGDPDSADLLEGFWNQLAGQRKFLLLCGYKVDLFDRNVQVNLLPQVYRAHSDVLPVVEVNALDRAVEEALVDVLGREDAHKVQTQVSGHLGDERLSDGQRTLMWVSAHMPRAAEKVLSTARDEYLRALEPTAA
jgi:hypothetical protein